MKQKFLLACVCLTILISLLVVQATSAREAASPALNTQTSVIATPHPTGVPTQPIPVVPRERERNPWLVIGASLIIAIILIGVIFYRKK